eukprot:22607-Chlamydomonas_euryale.AAC.1
MTCGRRGRSDPRQQPAAPAPRLHTHAHPQSRRTRWSAACLRAWRRASTARCQRCRPFGTGACCSRSRRSWRRWRAWRSTHADVDGSQRCGRPAVWLGSRRPGLASHVLTPVQPDHPLPPHTLPPLCLACAGLAVHA